MRNSRQRSTGVHEKVCIDTPWWRVKKKKCNFFSCSNNSCSCVQILIFPVDVPCVSLCVLDVTQKILNGENEAWEVTSTSSSLHSLHYKVLTKYGPPPANRKQTFNLKLKLDTSDHVWRERSLSGFQHRLWTYRLQRSGGLINPDPSKKSLLRITILDLILFFTCFW